MAKLREEEDRAARLKDELRLKEQKILESEKRKHEAAIDKKKRIEERTRGLVVWHHSLFSRFAHMFMNCLSMCL